MKTRTLIFLVSLFGLPLLVFAQPAIPADAETFFKKAMSQINPRHVSWVKNSGQTVNEKNMTESEVKNMASQYGFLGGLNNADIEALAFLVLMQAAKSAQEDLKAIMSKVKSINEQKKAMREALAKLQGGTTPVTNLQLDSARLLLNNLATVQKENSVTASRPLTTATPDTSKNTKLLAGEPAPKAEIAYVKDQVKNKLDSLSEMGEMESLNLQKIMDRMSTMISSLSNILKKISQTSDRIIQNLK